MSKRRKPGEIVRRLPGSGFCGAAEPSLVIIPDDEAEIDYCMMYCGDPDCREYANLRIAEGPFKGQCLYHISECQMQDYQENSDDRSGDVDATLPRSSCKQH